MILNYTKKMKEDMKFTDNALMYFKKDDIQTMFKRSAK